MFLIVKSFIYKQLDNCFFFQKNKKYVKLKFLNNYKLLMKSDNFYQKIQKSNLELFYYLFYDYNIGKTSSIIYDLINFLQLLSMNMSSKVNMNLIFNRH